jgi:hypothetical protein
MTTRISEEGKERVEGDAHLPIVSECALVDFGEARVKTRRERMERVKRRRSVEEEEGEHSFSAFPVHRRYVQEHPSTAVELFSRADSTTTAFWLSFWSTSQRRRGGR